MMVYDTALIDIRHDIRNVRVSTDVAIDVAINELMSGLDDIFANIWTDYLDLQSQIDIQDRNLQDLRDKDLQELKDEIASMQQEIIKERKFRENITLMFGIFSIVVIALNARTRK